ncbi:hypothetical protein [Pseudonocardia sp. NPDC049635]|uniref:hypothetical protein n=1 Tax=Pseudonocardia sp. NPDC049635 TaxID=3155506 RepID=UPI00340C91E4
MTGEGGVRVEVGTTAHDQLGDQLPMSGGIGEDVQVRRPVRVPSAAGTGVCWRADDDNLVLLRSRARPCPRPGRACSVRVPVGSSAVAVARHRVQIA